jgi:tetratricopeptide (TPR) repeat protein
MSEDDKTTNVRRCPDCGFENPAGAQSCESCNFPLAEGGPPGPAPKNPDATPAEPAPVIAPPPRLQRLREKRKRQDPSMTLWLAIGGLGAIALLFIAVQGFQDSNFPAVEGARPEQQQRADELRALIQEDSTNVAARVALGDVLYDTGNWPDAIVQYRAAVRMDSTKTEALVDLGVCYYNLGFSEDAKRHFELALARDPRQTVALFNMGIVHERRGDPKAALGFYQRSLETNPPESMRPPIQQAIERTRQAAGG